MARAETTSEPTRRDRRRLYHKLLQIVEFNTGDGARPTMPITSVLVTAGNCDIDADRVRSAIQAAVDNGDLVRVDDRVARTDEATLRDVIAAEGAKDDSNKQLIGWCYREIIDDT